MSWKRYFTVASTNTRSGSLLGGRKVDPKNRNYSSYLPDVYTGHPNRADRLRQYENMDADSEVNAALDILAEFCSQTNSENGTPFRVFFKEQATNAEIRVIKTCLQQWTKLNKFHKRIFRIVRNVFKNGDAFFVRDPENFKWMYVDPSKVVQIVVNESEGKEPAQYFIRDWNPNFEALTTTALMPSNINGSGSQSNAPYTTTQAGGGGARGQAGTNYAAYNSSGRFQDGQQEYIIDAKHVIHLSMSDGLDTNFPFGTSILESIFKVYKQKELLEDAIIIYRVQRAPERRVFYIDVGGMPSHLAMSFVERIKNEVNQRRIPSAGGGAQSVIDAGYNPIGINDDYFFPQCLALDQQIKLLDGRDVTLQEVINEYNNGKENWVYAVNQETHLIEPGRIAWAGKTRLNAELVEVTLDNGAKIKLTPDHRFIMRDGSEVEAKDLKAGDSVMPLYLHGANTGKHQGAGKYLKYTCNQTGKKQWVHTMVCKKSKPGKFTEIHHIDCNSLNNNPSNLVEMETTAHRALHKTLGTYHLTKAWNDADSRKKLVDGIRKYHQNATAADKAMFAARGKINGQKTWTNPVSRAKVLDGLARGCAARADKRRIKFDDSMCRRFVELYNLGANSIGLMTTAIKNDAEFQACFRNANKSLTRDKNRPNQLLATDRTLRDISKKLGYKDWADFKASYAVNHKVVSVVHLDCREDTGDITVESASGAHTFALTAGVFVHNSAEGRGSKVEILPGGCLEMDTRVWLTDGRILSIAQLTEEYAAGKENWTYSVNPENGNIVPGLISWAGVTQESAQVVKLTLDNGNTLTCTPDHKFPIPGKGLVRADQLAVGDNFVTYNPYNDAATAKLARIQKLTEPTQVGTLTIDVDEIHHGYHNFALEIGIFTQNSNLGEIDDLKFFTNKLFRALRIPSSYLPTGSDDGGSNFNDGRVGTAYIQELRFNEYCERLQSMMQEQFDTEFKMFLHSSGVNVDSNIFDVKFNPPQNFASYRQAQMDTDRVNTFNTMSQSPFVSKRFALRRFLNLSTEEVAENERLWREENINAGTKLNASAEMRSAGITAAGVGDDLSNFSDPNLPDELDQDQEGTTNNQQSTNTRNMGSTANTPQGNQTQSPG